jgi:hypothetical protein
MQSMRDIRVIASCSRVIVSNTSGVTTQNSKEKVQLQHSVAAELQHSYSELQQSYRKCCSRVIASCSRVIVSNNKWSNNTKFEGESTVTA